MSEKEQPKKNNSDDEQSEHSNEGPRHEQSPSDVEDKFLLSPPPPAGAELPVASGSGASSSSKSTEITGFFKKLSPFKNKDPKRPKKESSFTKAKAAFRKTFRKSDTNIPPTDPGSEGKRQRKISDPTHLRTKDEPKAETEPKKSFFSSFSASTSKETTKKTKEEQKTRGPKSKKGFFGHFSGSTSKETTVKPESKKTKSGPAVQKKALSRRASNQPSIGGVSVGFFNEALQQSESSGVPTESTSLDTQDIKSGSSFSPGSSSQRPSIKRPRAKETDESSLSDE